MVFVTGANSFLGAALARRLLAAGYRVRGLVRPNANDLLLRGLDMERVAGDLLQPHSYRAALEGCQAFFHVAAAYTHDPAGLAVMEAVNVDGTRHALSAALEAGVPRLLHTSTIGAIGQPQDGSLATEDTPFNLPNPTAYVLSKRAGEQIADAFALAGAHVVVVHPTGMLGPGDWRPSASGRLVLDSLHRRPLRYPPGGINWCPVDDVAAGMILAVERGRPGRRYILGHRHGNLGQSGFVALLRQAAGRPWAAAAWRDRLAAAMQRLARRRRPVADRPVAGAAPGRLTCNPARAIAELGMPQTSLLAAAQAEVQWYRQHGYAR